MNLTAGELVAVYGTLKRGGCNHRLLAGSHWLGPVLLSGLRLHDLGPYPMAVACADPGALVATNRRAYSRGWSSSTSSWASTCADTA